MMIYHRPEILAFALAEPGDHILTTRPVYGHYELDFGIKAGVNMLYADTKASECFQPDVVSILEETMTKATSEGKRVRALLIVNPHNPLGKCYPRSTLLSLMRFAQKHNTHLISDEIFGLAVFDNGDPSTAPEPFTSLLSIDTTGLIPESHRHVIYGLSKDFSAPGLRIGALVTHNAELKKACRAQFQFHDVSGPAVAIATSMLSNREWSRSFLALSSQKLGQAYKHVTRGLDALGINYLKGGNAGFFVWIDLSPYLMEGGGPQRGREEALAERLVAHGIFLHPNTERSMEPGWFRFIFTHPEEVVTEGLKR
jgi:1-aminocyclopropane-1-carboxylate synthase